MTESRYPFDGLCNQRGAEAKYKSLSAVMGTVFRENSTGMVF
ncbi:MAG: hypothetical protein AAF493_12740 [Pseudomonadota bacterium]